ncbi:type VI secretion system tip protein TssI/VgrG [Singulisphaera sp. Ch08]|uniref:Type VI secretion system tip protein TssI/VgrG n=1 Tax=Singulisphaera sp. Ch08 TaxID=3120278 RepID=A0AAU7CCP3_9BACT
MSRPTQPDVLKVQTPLGSDALLLEKFRGHERLSAPFQFELDLLAEDETDIAFKKVLGQSVTVSLQRPNGATRYFNGIISRFSEGEIVPGPKGEPTFVRYQAVMVPKLWLLSRNVQSRNFQQMTVPDILMKVLSGLDVANRIQGQFAPRDYCAQYGESDLAFASRLMEDEGIFYYFEHSSSGHQMILANTPQAHPEVDSPSRVVYERIVGGTRKDERVTAWTKSQEIRSGKSTLWDFCFEMPDKPLKSTRQTAASATAGAVEHSLQVGNNDQLEIYEYPGGFAGRFDGIGAGGNEQQADLSKIFDDGTRTVGIRMQEEAAAGLRIEGQGGCRQFSAGAKFTLQGHRNGDGPYVLTEVKHEASLEGSYTTGSPASLLYHNTFQCIPFDLPFRPARTTPKPRVEGPQTAVVVGPSGDDPIFCDKYGRVKVQFRWDRQGQFNADSSCWIRVAQPWAGSNWGAITLPRIGQEVVVGFLEGDPDEPMILGSVYNAVQMPPFPLPDQKTQSGFKTRTVGSGASQPNFSGIRFEDTQGGEFVHIHSERDMSHSTEGSMYVNVASQKHEHVGSFHSRQVGSVIPGVNHAAWPSSGSSGAGGGGQEMDTDWQPTIGTTPAMNLDLTVGWHRNSTLGLYSWNLVGQISSTKINPLALLSIAPSTVVAEGLTSGLGSLVQGFSTAAQAANIDVILGGNVAIQYGPKFEVRRGTAPFCVTPSNSTASGIIAAVFASLYSAFNIGEIFLAAAAPSMSSDQQWGELAGVWVVNDLILGAWIYAEALANSVTREFATVAELKQLTTQVTSLDTGTTYLANRLRLSQSITNEQFREFRARVRATGDEGAAVDISGCHVETADVLYSLNAPSICLVSALEPTNDGPSLITIQALGNEEIDGIVLVCGSGMSVVQGGAMAWLRVETEAEIGSVTADCGADGTLTLQSGITQEPNCIEMAPEGITASSALMITVESEESSVKVDPVGVTTSAAESTISVTAEAITLTVAESVLAITAEGITISCGASAIEITAEGIVISGPMVDVTGDTEVGITGAAITIT